MANIWNHHNATGHHDSIVIDTRPFLAKSMAIHDTVSVQYSTAFIAQTWLLLENRDSLDKYLALFDQWKTPELLPQIGMIHSNVLGHYALKFRLDYAQAMSHYLDVYDYAKTINDADNEITALYSIVSIYKIRANNIGGLPYARDALAISKKNKNTPFFKTAANMAMSYSFLSPETLDSAPASVYIVQKGTPQIRPVLSALSSSAAATGITVGADANTPLTYSVNADWLEISSVEVSDSTLLGDGRTRSDSLRYSLSVNLEANTGDSPRNAVLTLMAEGKDTVEITVTQEAEPQADFSKSFFKGTCIMRFTATWCYNCPRMRRAIEAVAGQMPDRIVPINMYDMSSDGGLGFWEINHYMNLLEVTGFPTAIASNCIKIQNSSTSEAVMEIVEAVVNESIESYPANTAMEVYSSVAGDNVRVEGYIAIKDGSKNYTVNVFLLEDNITYPQSDESGTINDYVHSGVVRAVLTGKTGEPLQCNGSESTVHFSVEGEIPRSVLNADNLSVAVIVAYEGSPEVRTVAMAKYLETGQVYDNAVLLKANGGHSAFKYE